MASNSEAEAEVQPKRVVPPLYKASGDLASDRLAFFHILERLKTQKRTGWVDNKIPNPESISDHMYRMTVLAMCISDQTLDIPKCVMMAAVHDLAEAQVGDIAPREGIPKVEKRRLEAEAMQNFVHEMLHNSPAALKIMSLWTEYEDQSTVEARFVKELDLDRFEMAAQALEYERAHNSRSLQSFFDNSIPHIHHTEVREWGADLLREREEMRTRAEQQ
ncbi:HD domain-containing protein [Multifurca ochricompacta]|uniref:5'-deoxynucleotidase n=1 Tax=Multifurca ochricompacta TaxID=376703 RepID=A0AAD4M900_9AGAM|nr:HD domain-containing protein [Multifurca ochricompacta]